MPRDCKLVVCVVGFPSRTFGNIIKVYPKGWRIKKLTPSNLSRLSRGALGELSCRVVGDLTDHWGQRNENFDQNLDRQVMDMDIFCQARTPNLSDSEFGKSNHQHGCS